MLEMFSGCKTNCLLAPQQQEQYMNLSQCIVNRFNGAVIYVEHTKCLVPYVRG